MQNLIFVPKTCFITDNEILKFYFCESLFILRNAAPSLGHLNTAALTEPVFGLQQLLREISAL